MPVTFSNICSLNKLLIRPLLLFKSSSRNFSILSSPNTRNAGLVLDHNFSGLLTNKLGHHFARNHGFATQGNNEFSKYTVEDNKFRAPVLKLREDHDPEKVLALITALLGLLTPDQPQQSLGSRSNKDPKETLSQLAALLGLSTHDTHSKKRSISIGEEEEEENLRSSKKQKTIDNSDDKKNIILTLSNTPSPQLYETNLPSSQLSSSDDDTDSYSNYSTLSHVDSFLILQRQLYEYPKVQRAFNLVKATLLPILLQKLKAIGPENVTVKSGLETAASIDLLRLFGDSRSELDEIGRRALEGAKLLQEGQNKVINGKRMLECAFDDIPNRLEWKKNST